MEERAAADPATGWAARCPGTGGKPVPLSDVGRDETPRRSTGIAELDRVLGGGVVAGSLSLIGGDPGIGKSTLFLMATVQMAEQGLVLYASGEESLSQIRLRLTVIAGG